MSTLLQKRADAESDPLPDIDAADKENPLAVAEVRPGHPRGPVQLPLRSPRLRC